MAFTSDSTLQLEEGRRTASQSGTTSPGGSGAPTLSVDTDNDGVDEIDPLTQITVSGDTNSIFTQGATEELTISVGNQWPDADQLDGYEGSEVAIRAENETITGNWQFDANTLVGQTGSTNFPFQVNVPSGSAKSGNAAEWVTNICYDGTGLSLGVRDQQAADDYILKPIDTNAGERADLYIGASGATGAVVVDPEPASSAANAKLGVATVPSYDLEVNGTVAPDRAQGNDGYSEGWGNTGWLIAENGPSGKPDFMELTHLSVRGTLRVFELEVNQITFTKGPLGVTPGGGKLGSVDTSNHTGTNPVGFSGSTVTEKWTFENENGNGTNHGLAAGDRLLAQRFNPDNPSALVLQVRAYVDNIVDQTTIEVSVDDAYWVPTQELSSPFPTEETEGLEFIVAGSSNTGRDSILYFDPYDPGGSVLDGLSNFNNWDNRADFVRTRFGNLNSYYDYTSDVFGFAAGDSSQQWISADPTNGVRIVDNSSGNNDVLAQLQNSSLTLGKGDQIRFDPSASPEAYIEGTLQLGNGGELSIAPRLWMDSTDSFSHAPSGTKEAEETTSITVSSPSTESRTLSTSESNWGHRAEFDLSGASANVTISVVDGGGSKVLAQDTVSVTSSQQTFSLHYSAQGAGSHVLKVSNTSGSSITWGRSSIHSYPPATEHNKEGSRYWMTNELYSQFGRRSVTPGLEMLGKFSHQIEGELEARGSEVYWVRPNGTSTKLS